MNKIEELQKRALELEDTLELQVAQFKKDSKAWVQMGGVAFIAGLIAYKVVKSKKGGKKKKKTTQIANGETSRRKASFFSSFKKRLFLALLTYGQTKLFETLKKPSPEDER